MAYAADLGNNLRVYVENQGTQSAIAIISSHAGQQQSQSSSFTTGTWTTPPTLYRLGGSWILRIEAAAKHYFIQIQGQGMNAINTPPPLENAEVLPLEKTEPMEPIKPMQPMQPMQPMKMGDMEMRMNPMEMRMGNMQMSFDTPAPSPKNFCSQCGTAVQSSDRFCAHCGHKLS